MGRATFSVAVAFLLAIPSGSDLNAQGAGDRGELATFGVDFGAFSPMTTFEDEMYGESSFETGASIGAYAAAWPHDRFGLKFKVVRSQTDGANESFEFAPLAVQDPTQWSFTGEVMARTSELGGGSLSFTPYVGVGAGMRHYTWEHARHNESKFFALTAAGGADIRPAALGAFGVTAEVRAYRSHFNRFGINGGNWRPGTPARPVPDEVGTDIGFYGGEVDKVWSNDFLFSVGVAYHY